MLRFHHPTWNRLQEALDNDPIVRFESLSNHQHATDLRSGFDASAFDDVFVIDDQDVFALLIKTYGISRD